VSMRSVFPRRQNLAPPIPRSFLLVASRSATRQMLVEQRNDCARVTSLGFQARETQSLVRSSRKPPMGGLTREAGKSNLGNSYAEDFSIL
jgi:hypothetical protein